jgi:hypothetical protein
MAVQQTGNLRFLPKSRELVQEMPDLESPGTIKENELKIQKAREIWAFQLVRSSRIF